MPSAGQPRRSRLDQRRHFGPGFAGNFWSFAFGPKYFFTPNIYGRAAYRFDSYNGEKPGGVGPYDDGTKDSQHLFVFDMVATF